MSGVSAGIALVPLAVSAIPKIAAMLAARSAIHGVDVITDEKKRKRSLYGIERTELRRHGSEAIGYFRRDVARCMNEQLQVNEEASQKMFEQLEADRKEMLHILETEDMEEYQDYIVKLCVSREELTDNLYDLQQNVVKNYQEKISESMNSITEIINAQYTEYLSELEQYSADVKAKKERAMKIAEAYIGEAKVLIAALEEDYDGARLSGAKLIDLKDTLCEAEEQYRQGNFEAAIAVSKDISINTLEEIYQADCKRQEWDNYYRCAYAMAAELEAYMKGQEIITEDIKLEAEKSLGKELEEDIIGVKISDYTEDMENGMKQFDYLLSKVTEIKGILDSDEVKNIGTEQMKSYMDLLNSKIYPSVALAINQGILNMSNAFSRQNISEEIIDFFEEHNFNFDGYSYDEDRHDRALHIGLSNDLTGEEIVVTLAPELMGNGDVQTRVEINQLAGDETNEERKEYYRTSIQNVVLENTPGAQIKLECSRETRNKLSSKTELKDKIKS